MKGKSFKQLPIDIRAVIVITCQLVHYIRSLRAFVEVDTVREITVQEVECWANIFFCPFMKVSIDKKLLTERKRSSIFLRFNFIRLPIFMVM